MKKNILFLLLSCSLTINAFAQENQVIDTTKVNKTLNIETNEKELKDQEILVLYKDRLNLLSIKERQLKLYEQSLLSLKEEVNIMQSDLELKQTKVNEKEIALLRKELKLKEKQRDLEQLEEKLAQIDTIQLEREKSKMSNPSVMINAEANNKTKTYIKKSKVKVNNLISQDPEIKVEKKIENKTENKVEPEKKTEVDKPKNKVKSNKTVAESYVNSGLGQMKKDILDVE